MALSRCWDSSSENFTVTYVVGYFMARKLILNVMIILSFISTSDSDTVKLVIPVLQTSDQLQCVSSMLMSYR